MRSIPQTQGSQRDVVYLGWPIAPSYMSPNAGGWGGDCGVLANEYSCAYGAQSSTTFSFIGGVHIGAKALHDLNLIWFGYIARLSQ
jgi:hypothetical protein